MRVVEAIAMASSTTCFAGPGEPLEKHLSDVAECLTQNKITSLIARKLSRVFSVKEEEAFDIIVLAGLVHDVGKAHQSYRGTGNNGFFPRHEYYSTVFLERLIVKAFPSVAARISTICNLKEDSIFTVLLASTAFHHYSSKDYTGSIERLGEFQPLCDGWRNAFRTWNPSSETGKKLREAALELAFEKLEASSCYNQLLSAINRQIRPRILYAASAVLGVLNECDAEVARRNRSKAEKNY